MAFLLNHPTPWRRRISSVSSLSDLFYSRCECQIGVRMTTHNRARPQPRTMMNLPLISRVVISAGAAIAVDRCWGNGRNCKPVLTYLYGTATAQPAGHESLAITWICPTTELAQVHAWMSACNIGRGASGVHTRTLPVQYDMLQSRSGCCRTQDSGPQEPADPSMLTLRRELQCIVQV